MVYRVGIVGAGVIGQRLSNGFDSCDRTDVVAVCDLKVNKAENLAGEYNGSSYKNVDSMLEKETIDIVYVGVPPAAHYEIVKKAIDHELDIICEKPIAKSTKTGRKMVDLVNDAEITSAINLPFRYTPGFRLLVEHMKHYKKNQIRRVDLRFRFPRWPREWQDVDWLRTKEQGGPLREVGTHYFFALLELFGTPSSILAEISRHEDGYENMASGIISYNEFLVDVDLLTDIKEPEENSLSIHLPDRSFWFTDWYKLQVNLHSDDHEVLDDSRGNTTMQLVEEFCDELDQEDGNLVSFNEALKAQIILDSIYDSSGKWVDYQ